MTPDSDINLLMVHADDHRPVLDEALPATSARPQTDPAAAELAHSFWDEGGDPNDLGLQRWGVLAPEGDAGDRLLALIRPLIEHRRAQQGHDVPVYRVPPNLTPEAAMKWRKRRFETGADINVDLPRYQLILGDLDQISVGVQQVQAQDGYVGRLAFADERGYEAYVEKVLRWERQPHAAEQARSLFYTVHDGTAATALGHRALVAPGVDVVRTQRSRGRFPAREVIAGGDPVSPSVDELVALAAAAEPSVLFSLSHGEGPPRAGWSSPDEQRRWQGAMSFGRSARLTGDDLRARTFLPGGVWFMFACYGAGTPSTSAYRHWLEDLAAAGAFRQKLQFVLDGLPRTGERPFVADIPQAVLANPNGPLAFIGHVDLAWTYSFQELDSGVIARPAKFMLLLRALVKHDRVGVAMRELHRFFNQVSTELTILADEEREAQSRGQGPRDDLARRGHLWMLRQDLAGFVTLGDPAVRLPLARSEAPARDLPPPVEPPQELAPAPTTTGAPPTSSDAAFEQIEDAIAHMILGDVPLRTLAEQLGRSRAELERLAALYRDAGRRALAKEVR